MVGIFLSYCSENIFVLGCRTVCVYGSTLTLESALRLESERVGVRETKAYSPGFLLHGEDYRASTTSRSGTLEVMNQNGDQIICPDKAVSGVPDSCSSLTIFLD